MVNISKRHVDKQKLFKIYQLFFEIINKAGNKDEFMELIRDIFTPIEQIMIAKRIAIIYLLFKNIDQVDIADYLKVSRSTTSRIRLLFYQKDTKLIKIIQSILRKEKIGYLFEDLFADLFTRVGYYPNRQLIWKQEKRKNDRKMIDV